VLLTLEEKKVPYEVKLIDLGNKPEWSVRLSLPLFPFRRTRCLTSHDRIPIGRVFL
jgi:glutathione S-transferase